MGNRNHSVIIYVSSVCQAWGQGLWIRKKERHDCRLLEQWFSECDSIVRTWELVRNASSQALLQTYWIRSSEGGE